ncbi:adhesion G-protein coupled receptor G2-like [Ptychodera flava]|uniref:adhesion G-protein coupled receptor G2-like n=1 Tax=Ptychodera flava TaxID=63121 RepID=UPI003969DDCB
MAFYIAFLAPFCLVLLFNIIVFCLVVYQICRLNSKALTADEKYGYLSQLKAAVALVVLLGLTWTFAFFAVGQASLLFNYLFAIFNSLQGLFIFVFHCAMKKDVRAWWKKTFCRCKSCQQEKEHEATSSTNLQRTLKLSVSETDNKDENLYNSTDFKDQCNYSNGEATTTFKRHSNVVENDYQ